MKVYISKTLTGELSYLDIWYIQVCEDIQVFEELSGKNLQVVVG